MKLKATVELEISERERKKIAIEYLESLLPYDHYIWEDENGSFLWHENLRNHYGDIFDFKVKGEVTDFEVNLYKALEELKKS